MRELIQKLVDNGLTISSIARATGMRVDYISRWLKGDRNISAEKEEILRQWVESYKKAISELII